MDVRLSRLCGFLVEIWRFPPTKAGLSCHKGSPPLAAGGAWEPYVLQDKTYRHKYKKGGRYSVYTQLPSPITQPYK